MDIWTVQQPRRQAFEVTIFVNAKVWLSRIAESHFMATFFNGGGCFQGIG
jgi:hypothetical protein